MPPNTSKQQPACVPETGSITRQRKQAGTPSCYPVMGFGSKIKSQILKISGHLHLCHDSNISSISSISFLFCLAFLLRLLLSSLPLFASVVVTSTTAEALVTALRSRITRTSVNLQVRNSSGKGSARYRNPPTDSKFIATLRRSSLMTSLARRISAAEGLISRVRVDIFDT